MSTSRFPNIDVDREVCQGTGYCEELARTLFKLDDEGVASVVGQITSDGELDLARQAEDLCPTRAIMLRLAPRVTDQSSD